MPWVITWPNFPNTIAKIMISKMTNKILSKSAVSSVSSSHKQFSIQIRLTNTYKCELAALNRFTSLGNESTTYYESGMIRTTMYLKYSCKHTEAESLLKWATPYCYRVSLTSSLTRSDRFEIKNAYFDLEDEMLLCTGVVLHSRHKPTHTSNVNHLCIPHS